MMAQIDFLSCHRNTCDHLAPVWLALPKRLRGDFCVTEVFADYARALGVHVRIVPGHKTADALRGSHRLMYTCCTWARRRAQQAGRPVVYAEHGVGQTYHSSAAELSGRLVPLTGIVASLSPNQRHASIRQRLHPHIPVHVIGCPKLDAWADYRKPASGKPCVAFSTHFAAPHLPEIRGSFDHWIAAVRTQLVGRYEVLGHAHPLLWPRASQVYRQAKIHAVRDFAAVLSRADVYVCDNSSTLYEFAATGRPVVVLNPPWFRRDVQHGLRFWDMADVGIHCDDPAQLGEAVAEALADPADVATRRATITAALYPYLGQARQRVVDVLRGLKLPTEPCGPCEKTPATDPCGPCAKQRQARVKAAAATIARKDA